MPLVSVVVSTYNRAEYLPAAVESVLGQTFRDLELIVVDDGSTDDTRAALEPFRDRLRYLYQDNAERGAARNHGMRLSSGKYVAFLDSDDMWLPGKLGSEIERIRSDPRLGLVYSDGREIDGQGRPLGRIARCPREGDVLEAIVCDNFVTLSGSLVDHERFEAAGGFCEDRALSGSEDWEAWCRLAASSAFGYVPRANLLYRAHCEGTVARPEKMERSMRRALELIFERPAVRERVAALRARGEAYVHLVLASLYYTAGALPEVRRHLRQARAIEPGVLFRRRYQGLAARCLAGARFTTGLRRLKRQWLQRGGSENAVL